MNVNAGNRFKKIPENEAWLFEPENRHIFEDLKKSLKQKPDRSLGSFKKYAK